MYQNRDLSRSTSADIANTTAYVDDYLDCIESLPNDMQRNVSQMREIDSKYQEILRDIKHLYGTLTSKENVLEGVKRRRCLIQIQRNLVQSQELGDEKLQLAAQIVEQTENRLRNMEMNRDRVETSEKAALRPVVVPQTVPKAVKKKEDHHHHEKTNKRPRRQRTQDNGKEKEKEKEPAVAATETPKPAKKKKRSKTKDRVQSPVNVPIDPDEPTYCLCNQVSYGEMVGCDHKDCPYEWFHFGCVGLTNKPKGKWYCPHCIQEMKKGKKSK